MPEAKSKHIQHNNKKVTLSLKFYTQCFFFAVKLNVAMTSFSMWCVIMASYIESDRCCACHEILSSVRCYNLAIFLNAITPSLVMLSAIMPKCGDLKCFYAVHWVPHKNLNEHAKRPLE